MAPRDASRVQLDFPQLVADLIAQLRLTGTLGILELSDQVSPVFLVGSRGIVFGVENPVFASAGVFSGNVNLAPPNTVVADSGPLPAGNYDIWAQLSITGSNTNNTAPMRFQHRDAANGATLATLLQMDHQNFTHAMTLVLPVIGYTIGLNERLRVLSPGGTGSGRLSATIGAQLRPTP